MDALSQADLIHAEPAALPPPLPDPVRVPNLWQALGLLLLYFVLQLAIGALGALSIGLALGLQHGGGLSGGALAQALARRPVLVAANVVVTLAVAAGSVLWLARHMWPQLWSQPQPPGLGFCKPRHAGYYAGAVLLGLAIPVLGGALTQWLAQGHQVPQDIRQLGQDTPLPLRLPLAVLVVTLGPMVEELLFRGVLLSALLWRGRLYRPRDTPSRQRVVIAVLLTALLFGAVHLPDLGYLWYAVPNLVLLGLALGWLRVSSGSLWPCIIAHGANNLLAIAVWFAAVPSHA